ncbi:HK97 family phage prohead protease [Arthrobacter sp. UYCu712]|uniref:HK97 family phage prohead protease n=1 Tax=Arthrobacter sp. UYCu712 TaxID=3156340 RepID=UPI0033958C79
MDPILINKTFVAKAEATETPGEFTALVSAFGNEDSQGDVVAQGAFTKTLAEWIIKGRPIPAVWAHQFSNPFNFIGEYTAAEETEAGLKLTGLIDFENPTAVQVHKLMKRGLVVEFSISGLVRDYELIEKDDEDSWWPSLLIKDIDLWEAGPCFKGANDQTELISVKSDGRITGRLGHVSKEGRVLAQKHVDALKDAHAKLGEIIAAAEPAPADDDTAKAVTPPAPDSAAPATKSALTPAVRALLELS